MRANCIVRQVLGDATKRIHRSRVKAIVAVVLALIHGGEIGLAALGRAIGPQSYKHGIKRIDRIFGNRALFDELDSIYAAIARFTLRSVKRPVILVDWTEAGKDMCALSAAVPVQGRAITIYSVVRPISNYGSPIVEKAFLEKLKTLIAPKCKPILVGDAGFRGPWMKRVCAMQWDFVSRIRGRTQVQRVGETQWRHWKELWSLAGRGVRSLGRYRFIRTNSVEAQLVVVDRRSQRSRSLSKTKRRNLRAKRAAKAHREPWFLATSLTLPAKQITKIYASRMQIELTFRDLKSHRFGWSFEDARCRSTVRVAVQILLAALASLVTMLVGIAAEKAGRHKAFQANTITKRRVLSLVALGCAIIRSLPPSTDFEIGDLRDHLPFMGIR